MAHKTGLVLFADKRSRVKFKSSSSGRKKKTRRMAERREEHNVIKRKWRNFWTIGSAAGGTDNANRPPYFHGRIYPRSGTENGAERRRVQPL